MTVKEESHIFVEVNQADGRYYKSDFSPFSHTYGRTRVLIAMLSKDDEPLKYITCGTSYNRRNTTIEHTFAPGDYLITVQIYHHPK